MNWYKQAISQEDFYSFYAYSGLSKKDLEENPVLLYEMIEHLNYIRNYYLKYLKKDIKKELLHIYKIKTTDEVRESIKDLVNSLEMDNDQDFNAAINIFSQYSWVEDYGGKLWAEIVIWVKKLNKIGEIPQEKYSEALFNRMYRLIMILDTIHSLEHNTNMVLTDLPEGEYQWIKLGLEIAKRASNFYDIAKLSKNKKLLRYLGRKSLIEQRESKNVRNIYEDVFYNMLLEAIEINSIRLISKTLAHVKDAKMFEIFIDSIEKLIEDPEINVGKEIIDQISHFLSQSWYRLNFFPKLFIRFLNITKKFGSERNFLNKVFNDARVYNDPIYLHPEIVKYLKNNFGVYIKPYEGNIKESEEAPY